MSLTGIAFSLYYVNLSSVTVLWVWKRVTLKDVVCAFENNALRFVI